MSAFDYIKFGDGLDVTDEGGGVIRVDNSGSSPAAEDVTVDSTTLVGTGVDAQAVFEELDNAIADHLADTTAAHAATAILADSTTLVGTGVNVQAVLEELDNGIADHLSDAVAAHAATAISADSTTLVGTGTTVQAVFEELDDGIAATTAVASAALPAVNLLRCRATGDHAISSATETDITGMGMTLAANSVYSFQYCLRCSSNATTKGIQYYLTFPGNITRCDANLDYYITISAKGSIDVVNDTTSPITFEPLVSQGNVVLMNVITGTIEVGAAGGVLQLQHGTEDATLSTVFRGSYGFAFKH